MIVALLYGCGVFVRPDSKDPATDTSRPTVTLTQEKFDSLVSAATKSNQMEQIAQTEAKKMFSDYVDHVGWVVGLFGVLIAIIVGLLGTFVPYLTNKRFRIEMDGKIGEIKKDIGEHNKKIDTSEQVLSEYEKRLNDIKRDAEKTSRDAKAYAIFAWAKQLHQYPDTAIKKYGQAIDEKEDFWEAYVNRGNLYAQKKDYDRAIEDYNKSIELYRKTSRICLNRGIAYMVRGNDGDYELAMKDFETGLTLHPNESTRKKLENNKEKLKAKMQGPKEDA